MAQMEAEDGTGVGKTIEGIEEERVVYVKDIMDYHWEEFNRAVDILNEGMKCDRLKLREYMLWDMDKRHKEEVDGV